MNRRGFFQTLGTIAAGFTILPGALTYTRKWKPIDCGIYVPNPEYINAQFELAIYRQTPGMKAVLFTRTSWDQVGLVGEPINQWFPHRFNSREDFLIGQNIKPWILM